MKRLTILSFLFFSYFVQGYAATPFHCEPQQCVIVIDAGSSGSRLHLFHFERDEAHRPVHIEEQFSKKIRPGFASLELKQESINAYLQQLFADLPATDAVPVYFYATAGMRLLPQNKQRAYYAALQEWFTAGGEYPLAQAKTITGKEEGLYAWLTVNYQLGAFDDGAHPFVAVMDTGGASVQIALPVLAREDMGADDLLDLDVAGRHLTLFVHSFLGLGQNLLTQQFLDAEHCFTNGYQLPNGHAAVGNAYECQMEVSQLINSVHGVERLVRPAMAQKATDEWYAIGGLAALVHDQSAVFPQQQLSPHSLLEQANNQFCQVAWSDLEARNPQNDYLFSACLMSSSYTALMVQGYGINPDTPIHFLSQEQNGDWTLGVVLQQN